MTERVGGMLIGLLVGAGIMLLATQAVSHQEQTMQGSILADEMTAVRSEMQVLSNMAIRAAARIDALEHSIAPQPGASEHPTDASKGD